MPDVALQDPQARIDRQFDWSDWLLAGDSLVGYELTAKPATATLETPTFTDTAVTFWLSGLTDGQDYLVTCHVTTAVGREDDRSIVVKSRSR